MKRLLVSFGPSRLESLQLECSVTVKEANLEVMFQLRGEAKDLQKIIWPNKKPESAKSSVGLRRDELWKSTCLEIFLSGLKEKSYFELNVSPSGDWNVYSFSDYRMGMAQVNEARIEMIESAANEREFLKRQFRLCLDEKSHALATCLARPDLVFGATAVLEYQTGEREYWALSHKGDKPDFHLRSSFIGRLEKESS